MKFLLSLCLLFTAAVWAGELPTIEQLSAEEMAQLRQLDDSILLDVRSNEEFAAGHINGAINIPLDQISQRMSELPRNQPIIVYCRSGRRAGIALHELEQAGYSPLYELKGHLLQWQADNRPLVASQ